VWSWHLDADAKPARNAFPHSAGDGDKKARSPGSNCVFEVDL